MSEAIEITVSSQLKSANTTSDISYHSGKANRGKLNHTNPDIDKTRSHLNVEFDVQDRNELLHKHYDELIEKHNKNNNSAARRWDLEKYLATFEGKKVKIAGKETKNERWATASQISYFGSKDTLNPVLDRMREAGATQEEINNAYATGYREYIERHNEHFPTMPIYHSDVHFDETTPHGHDAIVVMGHTEKGRASDSVNNALAEHYGSYPKTFEGKKEHMERYREENDSILFDSIAPQLEELAKQYGMDIEFEAIRTGQLDSFDYREYKQKKDLQDRELELEELEKELEVRTKGQRNMSNKLKVRSKEVTDREKNLDTLEAQLQEQKASQIAREKELKEREEEAKKKEEDLAQREELLRFKENKIQKLLRPAQAVALAVLKGDEKRKPIFDLIKEKGIALIKPEAIERELANSIEEANRGVRQRRMSGNYYIQQQVAEQEAQQENERER